MTKRWITGCLLFALGCGSSFLVRLATAAVPSPREGDVEGLHYVDGTTDFTLKYAQGSPAYLVLSTRKPGTVQPANLQIAYGTGSLAISKKALQRVTIFRLTPVGAWQDVYRPCHGWEDCPVPRPLPPPPPPINPEPAIVFPIKQVPGPGQTRTP